MRDEPDEGSGTVRRVLDALPPVAYWGVDLRNRFANAAFADFFAVSPEVAKGRHMSEVLPRDVFALAQPYATRALAGEPQQFDRVSGGPSGTTRYVQVSFVPDIFDGEVRGIVVHATDITERKRNEQDLQLQAELLDLAHDAVIVRDPPENRVTFWNREAQHIYGYSRTEALGEVTHDLLATIFPESREAVDEALARDGRWVGELRHTRKDGDVIVVSSRQSLQRGADGRSIAIIELNSDITEAKRADDALRDAQLRLKAIFDHVPAGLSLRDLDGRYIQVNNYVARALGSTPEELSGSDPAEHLDPETIERVRANDREMTRSRQPLLQEATVSHADETDHHYHIVSYPVIDEHGDVSAFGSFSLDITERKRTEDALRRNQQRLDQAEQIAGTGTWEWDPVNDRIAWSAGLYNIFRLDPEDFEHGLEDWLEHRVYPDDRERVREALQRAVAERSSATLENRIVRSDGRVRTVQARADVVVDKHGAPIRMVAVVHDITEAKAAQEALHSASANLAQHARELQQITTRSTTSPDRPHHAALSARQLETLQLVAQGLTNAEIATRMFVSETTVKWHIKQILTKTGATNRTEAVARLLGADPRSTPA